MRPIITKFGFELKNRRKIDQILSSIPDAGKLLKNDKITEFENNKEIWQKMKPFGIDIIESFLKKTKTTI